MSKVILTIPVICLTTYCMQSNLDDFVFLRGVNYTPSYARNDVQIWMDYDSDVIDRELGYAERLRLNSVRIFLPYIVYEHNPKLFLERFDNFLSLCEKHGIRAMPVLFGSYHGNLPDLKTYRSDDWVASPGYDRLSPEHWQKLEQYIRDVVGKHRDDERIVIWDVMNEPMNTPHAKAQEGRDKIWTFLEHFLDYVNAQDHNHPTTVGFMHSKHARKFNRFIEEIDVLSWHNYTGNMDALQADIRHVKSLGVKHGKPVIISEIARRPHQNFWMFMPILKEEQIGWYFWELMLGSTQFSRGENPIQGVTYPDGTYRDPREIACIVGIYPRGIDSQTTHQFQIIDDTDTSGYVRYSQEWTPWKGNGPLGDTLHYANKAGEKAELTFVGTEVYMLHKQGPDCGIAHILIDGKSAIKAKDGELEPDAVGHAVLDTYAPDVKWNHRTLIASGLRPGEHTLTILVSGQKHPNSRNSYVQIISFEVKAVTDDHVSPLRD